MAGAYSDRLGSARDLASSGFPLAHTTFLGATLLSRPFRGRVAVPPALRLSDRSTARLKICYFIYLSTLRTGRSLDISRRPSPPVVTCPLPVIIGKHRFPGGKRVVASFRSSSRVYLASLSLSLSLSRVGISELSHEK